MMYWKHTTKADDMILFLEIEVQMPYTREWFLNDRQRLYKMYEKEFRKYRKRLSNDLVEEYKRSVEENRRLKQEVLSPNQLEEEEELPF